MSNKLNSDIGLRCAVAHTAWFLDPVNNQWLCIPAPEPTGIGPAESHNECFELTLMCSSGALQECCMYVYGVVKYPGICIRDGYPELKLP